MRKKSKILLIVSAVFICIAIAIGVRKYNEAPDNSVFKKETDFSTTADELYNAYQAGEQEANTKYLDKVIDVKGTISEVTNDERGGKLVVLKAQGAEMGGVSASFTPEDSKEVTKAAGEEIRMKCRCTGRNLFEEVELINCSEINGKE